MDKQTFKYITKSVFQESKHGGGDLVDEIYFTNNGVAATASDNCGTIGFGIAANLTLTARLVEIVADLNRQMVFGHYWLAPGSDDSHWSLLCGFKFQYGTPSDELATEMAFAVAQHSDAIVDAVLQKLDLIAHRRYWIDDADPAAQSLILVGHLS